MRLLKYIVETARRPHRQRTSPRTSTSRSARSSSERFHPFSDQSSNRIAVSTCRNLAGPPWAFVAGGHDRDRGHEGEGGRPFAVQHRGKINPLAKTFSPMSPVTFTNTDLTSFTPLYREIAGRPLQRASFVQRPIIWYKPTRSRPERFLR